MAKGNGLPKWVPAAVEHISDALNFDGGVVAERLLTDARMESVWKQLARVKVERESIDRLDPVQQLSSYGIPNAGITLADEACAAFFVAAVFSLGMPSSVGPVVRTRAAIDAGSDPRDFPGPWRAAAELCQWIMDNERLARLPKFSDAFSTVKGYLESGARLRERRNSPHVLEHGTGMAARDELRGKVRGLASETQKIFRSFRYGTLATVATIALDLPPEAVGKDDVRNWCADLARQCQD